MTSLRASQPVTAVPAAELDWSMLISADEAATLLGKTAGHLRRKLCPQLAERKLAMFRPGPEGGKARWWIDRRADMALAPGRAGESHRPPDRDKYSDDQNRKVDLKKKCVAHLRYARQYWPGSQKLWMTKLLRECSELYGKSVTRTTLLRWDKQDKGPGSHEVLIDKRGGDQKSSGDPDAWEYFKDIYLDDRQPSVANCWRRTKLYSEKRGLSWGAITSTRRQLNDRIPPEVQLFCRDLETWKAQCEAGIDQATDSWAAGELWIGDHAQLDLFARIPGKEGNFRPWITTWMDWRTRRIVGYHVGLMPNSTAILLAFRKAMLDETNRGGPAHVAIDNGKDYDCWMLHGQTKQERRGKKEDSALLHHDPVTFAGIFGELQIKAHFSIPHSPNGKSRLERWFLTMHQEFDVHFETYAGRNCQAKPATLAKIRKNPALVPTLDEVKREIEAWIAAFNKRSAHNMADLVDDFGRKLSPDRAMATWRDQVRIFNREALDLFLMGWHKPVAVTRRGIRIAPYGSPLHYGRWEPALMPYKTVPGQKKSPKVLVSYDPEDDRVVRVFTTRREFICEAKLDGMGGGANHEQHRAANREKNKYRKNLKHVRDKRKLMETYSPAEAALAEQPDEPPPTIPTALPAEMKIVQTPLDDQVEAIERERASAEMAMAAGAEHLIDDGDESDFFNEDETPTLRRNTDHDEEDSEGEAFNFEDTPAAFAGEELDDDTDVFGTLDYPPLRLADEDDGEDILEQLAP